MYYADSECAERPRIIPAVPGLTPGGEGTIASLHQNGVLSLGKGDKRTFRGKVFRGSHGKTRPRKAKKTAKKPG